MDFDLEPGRYVVAVSGGVDSMVLLDILKQKPQLELIVAHFDHGIRNDSSLDRKLVQQISKQYALTYIYDEGRLGNDASEEVARNARYEFLEKVRVNTKARGIITAHHEDDLLETAVINLLRGTGRRGLSSMYGNGCIVRPLLHIDKSQIQQYARENNINWREDSTNTDEKYLRNYIRQRIIPKLNAQQRTELLDNIRKSRNRNQEIDEIVTALLHTQPATNSLDRQWFIMLPHVVANEVMKTWLRRHHVRDISKKQINKLVNACKTSQANRVADIDKQYILKIEQKRLIITQRNR